MTITRLNGNLGYFYGPFSTHARAMMGVKGETMVMNPRTHPRGAPPDFTLPRKNPNPGRMTDALWWLVCMRELLEPSDTENGGTYANKPGYHNAGENLPDHGLGNSKTDHSIRRAPDRSGPWWKTKSSAHDWTFRSAQRGDYANIQKYTKRLVNAMRSETDLRPDDVFAYTLGQTDGDPIVEGYNEYTNDPETSGDKTHLWHRHDSFRRNIIGDFHAMWKALTIDMGWTYAEWQQSIRKDDDMPDAKAFVKELLDTELKFPYDPERPVRTIRDLLRYIPSRDIVANAVDAKLGERFTALGLAIGDVDEQVLAGLTDTSRSDEEVAADLRAALGSRADAVFRAGLATPPAA